MSREPLSAEMVALEQTDLSGALRAGRAAISSLEGEALQAVQVAVESLAAAGRTDDGHRVLTLLGIAAESLPSAICLRGLCSPGEAASGQDT